MHRLGEDSSGFYLAGGLLGRCSRNLLAEEQIRHEPFEIGAMTRESLVVYEESSEQQYRFGMPGPEIQERSGRNLWIGWMK
jgi:6-phosphofructokinase 2